MITTSGNLRRFGDVSVDPDHVLCVSRKLFKIVEDGKDEDGKPSTTVATEDRSTMLLRVDGSVYNVEISESAADDLLDHFQRKNGKLAVAE